MVQWLETTHSTQQKILLGKKWKAEHGEQKIWIEELNLWQQEQRHYSAEQIKQPNPLDSVFGGSVAPSVTPSGSRKIPNTPVVPTIQEQKTPISSPSLFSARQE